MTHGTRGGYQAGCQCLPCRAANAAYQAEYRRKLREGVPILGRVVSAVDAWRQVRVLKAEYGDERARVASTEDDGAGKYHGALAGLSRRLGFKNGHLQIGRRRATLRNVLKIRRLYRLDVLAGLEPEQPSAAG